MENTFKQLDTLQQVIHILANTMLVFPLRTQKTGKQEHRDRGGDQQEVVGERVKNLLNYLK